MIIEHAPKKNKLTFEQRAQLKPDKPTAKHYDTAQRLGWAYEGEGYWSKGQRLGAYFNGTFKDV